MSPTISYHGMTVNSFVLMLCMAVLVVFIVLNLQAEKNNMDINKIVICFGVSLPFIILCGKTLFVLTTLPNNLKQGIPILTYLKQSGFVFYGGLAGFLLGIKVYTYRTRQSFIEYVNFLSPYIPLGHAFGRIGCFLNGCCYGKPYTGIFAVNYPVNGKLTMLFPVQILESVACLLLSLFLFKIKALLNVNKISIYLFVYSVVRFLDEFLRGDLIRGIWFGLSTSQWISLFIAIGVIIKEYSIKRRKIAI